MMLETWEVRWFGHGAVPVVLQQWIEENELVTQPVRTDHYLIHSAGKSMGIKWREGSLQIKEMLRKDPKNPLISHYKKWSFDLKEEDIFQKIEAYKEWIKVAKKRELAKWRVEHGKLWRTNPGSEENGIELEVSTVMCREKLWSTIAFEATGGVDNLVKGLSEISVPGIEGMQRMGYAEWLEKLVLNGSEEAN